MKEEAWAVVLPRALAAALVGREANFSRALQLEMVTVTWRISSARAVVRIAAALVGREVNFSRALQRKRDVYVAVVARGEATMCGCVKSVNVAASWVRSETCRSHEAMALLRGAEVEFWSAIK